MGKRIDTEELGNLADGSPPQSGMDCSEVIKELARRVIAAQGLDQALRTAIRVINDYDGIALDEEMDEMSNAISAWEADQ